MAFLVLENPEQYIAADIEPPQGFGESWLKTYQTAKTQHDLAQKSARDERFAFVADQWDQTRQWWNAQYDQEGFMRRKVNAADSRDDQLAPPPLASPPPPPPPAMAAATAPAPEEEAGRSAFVTETAQGSVGGNSSANRDEVIVVTAARRTSALQDTAMAESSVGTSGDPDQSGTMVQVSLAEVLSDRPYLDALGKAEPSQRMQVLAEQERAFGSVPGFYFDVAEWFRLNDDAALSRQLLLSALDLKSSDDETL